MGLIQMRNAKGIEWNQITNKTRDRTGFYSPSAIRANQLKF